MYSYKLTGCWILRNFDIISKEGLWQKKWFLLAKYKNKPSHIFNFHLFLFLLNFEIHPIEWKHLILASNLIKKTYLISCIFKSAYSHLLNFVFWVYFLAKTLLQYFQHALCICNASFASAHKLIILIWRPSFSIFCIM